MALYVNISQVFAQIVQRILTLYNVLILFYFERIWQRFQTEMILVDLQKSLWHVKITLYFYKKWNVLVLIL